MSSGDKSIRRLAGISPIFALRASGVSAGMAESAAARVSCSLGADELEGSPLHITLTVMRNGQDKAAEVTLIARSSEEIRCKKRVVIR